MKILKKILDEHPLWAAWVFFFVFWLLLSIPLPYGVLKLFAFINSSFVVILLIKYILQGIAWKIKLQNILLLMLLIVLFIASIFITFVLTDCLNVFVVNNPFLVLKVIGQLDMLLLLNIVINLFVYLTFYYFAFSLIIYFKKNVDKRNLKRVFIAAITSISFVYITIIFMAMMLNEGF